MAQQYKTVTTNLGRNAVQLAISEGSTVKLTHMAVGDGNGQDVTPRSDMTALVHEVYKAQINMLTVDPETPDQLTAELVIPESQGGWYIREVGIFMEDGTLFAIGNTPLTEKTDIQSGSATDMTVKMIIRVQDTDAIDIVIDPAQVLAVRKYVDDSIAALKKVYAPIRHAVPEITYGPGTDANYGHLKLSDSVTGTENAATGGTAATPKAVKDLDDALKASMDKGIKALEAKFDEWRKAQIGSIQYFATATLPEGYVEADGSEVLFEDYPELKEAYDAGRFNDMLLENDALAETKAAWKGKWVKNGKGTGLFTPSLQGLFLRNSVADAGMYEPESLPNIKGTITSTPTTADNLWELFTADTVAMTGALTVTNRSGMKQSQAQTGTNTGSYTYEIGFDANKSSNIYGKSSAVTPVNVHFILAIYLGKQLS